MIGLIIGSIPPLLLGLISVTIWFLVDKAESRPLLYLAFGLLTGALIDLKFLKGWNDRRFSLPIWFIILIYLICNVFVYGFFMGFPVFNALLGLLAGYYFGNRVCFNKVAPEKYTKQINQVSMFAGLTMTFICISSGFLALYDNGAAGMIQNVLGLSFEVTRPMLWGIVLLGSCILILANYFLTRATMVQIRNKKTPAQ